MAINLPEQRQRKDAMGQLLGTGGAIAGGIVGGVSGGPMGAVTGATAGNSAGQAAAGLLSTDRGRAQPGAAPSGAKDAMARRAASLQPLNPADYGTSLAKAETAAAALPPELQQQYVPALQAARQRAGVA